MISFSTGEEIFAAVNHLLTLLGEEESLPTEVTPTENNVSKEHPRFHADFNDFAKIAVLLVFLSLIRILLRP